MYLSDEFNYFHKDSYCSIKSTTNVNSGNSKASFTTLHNEYCNENILITEKGDEKQVADEISTSCSEAKMKRLFFWISKS